MCSCNFYFIRFFFYLGRAPREVEEFQVTADSSEILKKAGEMNKGILHDNLLSLFDLSDYYDVAESNENIGDTMIPNTSPNITFGVSEVSSNGIASRAAARLLVWCILFFQSSLFHYSWMGGEVGCSSTTTGRQRAVPAGAAASPLPPSSQPSMAPVLPPPASWRRSSVYPHPASLFFLEVFLTSGESSSLPRIVEVRTVTFTICGCKPSPGVAGSFCSNVP